MSPDVNPMDVLNDLPVGNKNTPAAAQDEPAQTNHFGRPQRSLLSTLRMRRGWSEGSLTDYDDPSHPELKDTELLCQLLYGIRERGEKIVVLPDYDMDGITSGVLGWAGLAELGFDVELYVPDHRRGHDVAPEALDELVARHPGVQAVITCDGGVNSHPGIQRGVDLGLTMLVTDHHVQLPIGPSPAAVVVDPERIDEDYPHPGICGAFVLWQCLDAFARRFAPHKVDDIRLLRLFAGIGTVSDVMPLLYENRQIVRDSVSLAKLLWHPVSLADLTTEYDIESSLMMKLLRTAEHSWQFLSAFEGFALCLQVFREPGNPRPVIDAITQEPALDDKGEPVLVQGSPKLRRGADISEEFYGFYLAPAFNSVRRVDGDMAEPFGAFTASTKDQKLAHIQAVVSMNEERKEATAYYMDRLHEIDQPFAPWAWLTDAPGGMLGLMASNLMNESGLPTIVVNNPADPSEYRGGSARTPHWFPLISTMTPQGFTAVGHENACGVQMADLDELERFVEALRTSSEEIWETAQQSGSLEEANKPDLVIGGVGNDGSLDDGDELLALCMALETMRPFGHAFPPVTAELIVDLSQCSIGVLGSTGEHMRIVLPNGLKLVWWSSTEHLADLQELSRSPIPGQSIIRLRAKLSLHEYMGNVSVQATIENIVPDDDEEGVVF